VKKVKPELALGTKHSIQIKVTKEMFAQFEGKMVHPVYSTATMVYHMEWVSRQIILPVLELSEEGMGAEVKLKHLAPATEGMIINFEATVIKLEKNIIVTKVEAAADGKLVGQGEVTQVVLPKSKIELLIGIKNNR
jgi:predicted thioesterase